MQYLKTLFVPRRCSELTRKVLNILVAHHHHSFCLWHERMGLLIPRLMIDEECCRCVPEILMTVPLKSQVLISTKVMVIFGYCCVGGLETLFVVRRYLDCNLYSRAVNRGRINRLRIAMVSNACSCHQCRIYLQLEVWAGPFLMQLTSHLVQLGANGFPLVYDFSQFSKVF